MKIFEVTQINEAAPGSFGAQAGLFAKGIAQNLLAKADPNLANLGPNRAVGAANRSMAAAQMTMAAVPKLATQAMTTWENDLATMMKNSRPPALTPAALPQNELEDAAWKTIDALLGQSHTYLEKNDSPQGKQAWANLQQSHTDLIKASTSGDKKTMQTAWNDVARDVVLAQNALTFSSGSAGYLGTSASPRITMNPQGQVVINGRVANLSDPNQAAVVQALIQGIAQMRP